MKALIEHQNYLAEQHQVIGELIEEGVQNQIAVTGTIAAIGTATAFVKVAAPIIKGVAKIWTNIVWGDNVTVRTIDPEKIDAAFNDSKVFVAEIKRRFPNSHAKISKIRQNMKIYQLDLSNIVMDLKLMTDSTVNDVKKSMRTLNLRKKILNNHSLAPEKDVKIWDMTIK